MPSGLGSLLREIDSLAPKKAQDRSRYIKMRGENAYAAVRKLITVIEDNCGEEEAADLIKRFFNAARTGKFRKFELGVSKLDRKEDEDEDSPGIPGGRDPDGRDEA